MLNKKRHGKGVMVYFNSRLYEGSWQNDCKFGKGLEIYPNGNLYEGYYVNGKPEGNKLLYNERHGDLLLVKRRSLRRIMDERDETRKRNL